MKYYNNLFIFVITVVVLITVVVHGAPGRGSFGGRGGFGGSRGGGSRGSSSRGSGSGSKSSGGWFGGWFSSSKSSSATASHLVASAPSHSSVNSVSNTRPIGWQLNNGQHIAAPKSVSKLYSGISKPVASAPSLASVNEHQMIGGKSAGSAPIGWNVPNSKPVGPPPAYPGLEKMPVGTMHNSPPAYSPSLDKMPPPYSSINHLSPGASSGSHLGPPAYSPSLDKMPPPYSSINHMSPGASSGSHLGPPAYSAVPVSGGMAAQPPIAVVNNYPVASHGSSFGSSWGTHALAFQLGAMNSHSHSSHIHHYYHGSSTTSTTTPSPAVAPAVELSSVATPLAPYPFVYFDHNGLVVIPTSSNVTTPASNATSEIKATNMTEVTSESTVNPPNVTNEMKATKITKVTSGSTVNPPNVISEATAKPPKVTREIPMMSTTESLSINLDNQPLIEASKLYHVSSIPMTTTTELPAPVESSTTSTYDSWNSYLAKIIVDILYRTASKKAINIETTTVMDPKTNDLTP